MSVIPAADRPVGTKVIQQRPNGVTLEVQLNGHLMFYKDTYRDGKWFRYPFKNHRDGGPSIIAPYGYIAYRVNDQYHRDNGPAVVDLLSEGATRLRYYIRDKQLTAEEYFLKYGVL